MFAEPNRFGMQTSNKRAAPANSTANPMHMRVAKAFKWCEDRGIGQVYKFFQGCDNSLSAHEARIRLVIRTTPHTAVKEDEKWVRSMELTMAAIDNRKNAA